MATALVEHCLELLAPLGTVRARRMFGGHGLYCDDLFFALIALDRLYLKTDAVSQPAFAAAGCEPFVYLSPPRPPLRGDRPPGPQRGPFVAQGEQGNLGQPGISLGQGKRVTMSYWTAPPAAMESPAEMQPWARLALAAALRARAAKPSAAPRKARAQPAQAQAGTARRKP
jgi:DNA transformation protein and related proteins